MIASEEVNLDKDALWKVKLASWLHDPLEKALILGRTREGHEGGNVKKFRDRYFPEGMGTKEEILRKADRWASAADRPQWPQEGPQSLRVSFVSDPLAIHPLSGEVYDRLSPLSDVGPEALVAEVGRYLEELDCQEAQKTLLSFWRFAPEIASQGEGESALGLLWNLLPADTRVPDHTIWNHLDISSAFAGAMAGDPNQEPALLQVTIGPVQSFIELGRSLSDLWAGSHFLSSLTWEAMRPLVEEWGPDAVVYPQLRGIPLVDQWLIDHKGIDSTRFKNAGWKKGTTDSNPFYTAALPNKFVALVPASEAAAIAQRCADQARKFAYEVAREALDRVLKEVGADTASELYCDSQLDRQMEGFPEVTWSVVPWRLVVKGQGEIDTQPMEAAMLHFSPVGGWTGDPQGVWKTVLSQPRGSEGGLQYKPNPGVLYPAIYELLDRTLAATKSQKLVPSVSEEGHRESFSGEREWLAERKEELFLPPGKRKEAQTLWTRLASKRPSWVKKGEHLDSFGLIKRLWPTLFTERLTDFWNATMPADRELFFESQGEVKFSRYVLSTHTMALAGSLERLLNDPNPDVDRKLEALLSPEDQERSRLPRKMVLSRAGKKRIGLLSRLLAHLDAIEEEEEGFGKQTALFDKLRDLLGHPPESYYAFLLCDGDDMGAWLSGGSSNFSLRYEESWHTKVRQQVRALSGFEGYLKAPRSMSPGHHAAISSALSNFAALAPKIVEERHLGKLLYAGGDDLMAMVSLCDLLEVMGEIRSAYSGVDLFPAEIGDQTRGERSLQFAKGFALESRGRQKTLRLMMGKKATLSMGVVIAHHQAPLGMLLRELRKAEKLAKAYPKKNAFTLSLLKRSGGASHLTLPWSEGTTVPLVALDHLSKVMGRDISRRAAYLATEWINRLPGTASVRSPEEYFDMVSKNLAYQFARQSEGITKDVTSELAQEVVGVLRSLYVRPDGGGWTERALKEDLPKKTLVDILTVSEFLGREGRRDGK